MGHQDKIKKLGRTKPHREQMLANMAMSLIMHRMIKTTDAKAKALRPVVDRLITNAKKDTLASKRLVARTVHVKEVFKKFYSEVVPQFGDRTSGYTRVMKLGVRRGDGAPISVVELLTAAPEVKPDAKDKKSKKKTARKTTLAKKAKK